MHLSGKRVLITGGSSGIGLGVARALLGAGAHVVITGRRADQLHAAVDALRPDGDIAAVVADVGTDDGRKQTLAKAINALGGLDILVNNAGGVRAGRLERVEEDDLRAMLEVDLVAPILLTRDAVPVLRASGEAMIVNISSVIALVGIPFYATYAAAKAGLAQFSEALRRELYGEGIHVLTVFPAGTDTAMMQTNEAGADLGFGREPVEDVAAAIVAGIEGDALSVVRGQESRAEMLRLNRDDPAAVDAHFLGIKHELEAAVRSHRAL